MSEMVERVAIAISGQDAAGWAALPENKRERIYGGGRWVPEQQSRDEWRYDARAAIAAMREPTQYMFGEANRAWASAPLYGITGDERTAIGWRAMIDAALEDKQ